MLIEMWWVMAWSHAALLVSQAKERRKRWMVEAEVDQNKQRVVREAGGVGVGVGGLPGAVLRRCRKEVGSVCVCDEWEEGSEA